MAMITILDQNTINKIAAGEVIERPASVVKELLENAIDAKATAVTVEIRDGGTSMIRVTDNGSGIPKDQISLAFLRHATSKIRAVEDLFTISSLGFRGEALASIAAVSQVELITKTNGSLTGFRYEIEGGAEKGLEEVGAPDGTTFIARNLFYNTPVRRKFLKSPATEGAYVADLVEKIALSHPDISLRFIQNNQNKLYTSGNNSLKDLVYTIYGREVAGNLLEVQGREGEIRISGFAGKPLIGVHHIEGHVSANFIEHPDLEPPFVCLIVSGGHTHLVIVKDYGEFEILGRTRDDAAGEAFDKVARAVGLGYPGGPKIDKAAREGNPDAIDFPRGKIEGSPYDFSFSGLKSCVLNYINHAKMTGEEIRVPDLAASFQHSVVDSLVSRTIAAAREYGYRKVAIAGGVASNSALRAGMKAACRKAGLTLYYPSPIFCTDNAAMIGVAGYYEYMKGNVSGWDLNAVPNLKLGER